MLIFCMCLAVIINGVLTYLGIRNIRRTVEDFHDAMQSKVSSKRQNTVGVLDRGDTKCPPLRGIRWELER